jgi:hypothetical protein
MKEMAALSLFSGLLREQNQGQGLGSYGSSGNSLNFKAFCGW